MTKHYPIPIVLNIALAVGLLAVQACILFVIPLYLLPLSLWWALLLIPFSLLTNTYWALIHEAIHGMFLSNHRLNEFFGRIMAISFGTVFHFVRFGHLIHHQYNRTSVDLTDGYDPQQEPKWKVQLGYYFQICGGLYLAEILG